MFRRFYRLITLILLLVLPLQANQPLLTPEQMRTDLDFFWQTLKDQHPKVDYACPMADLEAEISRIRAEISSPMTLTDFFKHLSRVVSRIRDSHTLLLYPPVQNDQIFPPFDLLFIDKRCLLKKSYAEAFTPYQGQAIEAINRRPWTDVYENMTRIMAGETDEIRRNALQSDTFKILWPILYPLEEQFSLTINGQHTPLINGISRQTIRQIRQTDQKSPLPTISFEVMGKIALITLRSFEDRDLKKEWSTLMGKVATESIQAILLDLRGNLGGDTDLGEGVAATFLARGVRFFPHVTLKVSQAFRDQAKKQIPGLLRFLPLQNLSTQGKQLFTAPLGSLLDSPDNDPPTSPFGTPFFKPLWVMIDGNTVSTAAILARLLQVEKRATLIGRPAGSARDGLFGQPLISTLPSSKLNMKVSSMVLRFDNRIPEGPVPPLTPDILLEPLAETEIAGGDSLLDQALERMGQVIDPLPPSNG